MWTRDLLLSDYWWVLFVVPAVAILGFFALFFVADRKGWLPAFAYKQADLHGTAYQKFLFVIYLSWLLFLLLASHIGQGDEAENEKVAS